MIRTKAVLSILLLELVTPSVFSSDTELEIEFLLDTIKKSGCVFVRNGKDHTATEAENHLRMKYSKGKKWVKSAEQFIERIATKSSLSGSPYYINCIDTEQQLTGKWLSQKLADYRSSNL